MDDEGRDPRWDLLVRAQPKILAATESVGVEHLEFIAAFPDPRFAIWLGTRTDHERDQIGVDLADPDELPPRSRAMVPKRATETVTGLVRQALTASGFERGNLATFCHVVIEEHRELSPQCLGMTCE